jgi:adenosylcobinamide kinase / adenosylcobinamide-phosphate guanylyltransferase
MSGPIILVSGPARSGKSEWAEDLAEKSDRPILYIATAQDRGDDAEWRQRIALHQARRPTGWQTLECPLALTAAIAQADPQACLLVDSLGTWVANLLETPDSDWQGQVDQLLAVLKTTETMVVFVAEETGWGVVPAYPMGRAFRDRLGRLTRMIAAIATKTYLVTAGHALDLSAIGIPLTAMGDQGKKS